MVKLKLIFFNISVRTLNVLYVQNRLGQTSRNRNVRIRFVRTKPVTLPRHGCHLFQQMARCTRINGSNRLQTVSKSPSQAPPQRVAKGVTQLTEKALIEKALTETSVFQIFYDHLKSNSEDQYSLCYYVYYNTVFGIGTSMHDRRYYELWLSSVFSSDSTIKLNDKLYEDIKNEHEYCRNRGQVRLGQGWLGQFRFYGISTDSMPRYIVETIQCQQLKRSLKILN